MMTAISFTLEVDSIAYSKKLLSGILIKEKSKQNMLYKTVSTIIQYLLHRMLSVHLFKSKKMLIITQDKQQYFFSRKYI